MTPEVQTILAEYDGFLNALRCFLGYRRVFGCFALEKTEGYLETYITQSKNELERQYEVDYHGVRTLFGEYLFRPLEAGGFQNLENTDWVLFEYYGLISTTLDENGPWNPIVGGQTTVLEFVPTEGVKNIEFVVEVGDIAIVTFLAKEI
ncbi:hypothetical protein [Microbulbifer taiwanensis]|uniref:Uncharacterized protein n=1 Tax=Microbulbifer taiwanensis TaxID=986746 RepID=A0ABW1YSI2_9GAMM|nr:hypothetical protein [Microbulbifer taiwanensis]